MELAKPSYSPVAGIPQLHLAFFRIQRSFIINQTGRFGGQWRR
jgi:hypothetical protein